MPISTDMGIYNKITARVRSIGARKMSYAGRLTLVNAVFNTLHNYWASIFIIPKCVIKRIEAICRTFFWEGGVEYQRAPLVAWHNVCCSKQEGGLGVKQVGVWNIAIVGKLVNWIYTKADRLWVLWIDQVYLKGRDWNSYQPPADSNWNWRNICKVRDCMAAGYLNNVWMQDPKGYSVASGYHWLHGIHPHVQWYDDIWDVWGVPKHTLIGWLIKHEALNTRMKLKQIGICSTDQCVLCENGQETHEHLFDQCAYSRRVLQYVSHWLQDTGTQRSSTVQTRIRRVAMLASWYLIWLERNQCRHELMLARPEKIGREVQLIVRQRMQHFIQKPVGRNDKIWLGQIGIYVISS
ncbi:uncharacterized protein LOC141588696 [Silene latifolia]|uniref:uncharacterized protein LOC141588696 n=1 Tax=Silene latifolia TaxID=37657 RepID=UPI003D776C6A